MLRYHSYHIYGTWRGNLEVRGRFLSHHIGGKPQSVGTIFMGGVEPLRKQVNILIWQLEQD